MFVNKSRIAMIPADHKVKVSKGLFALNTTVLVTAEAFQLLLIFLLRHSSRLRGRVYHWHKCFKSGKIYRLNSRFTFISAVFAGLQFTIIRTREFMINILF